MTETTQAEQYANTVHFTGQQIEDYCTEIEKMPEHTQRLFEGVQIIRQLQEKKKMKMNIEPISEKCQDQYAIKELQIKINELIEAFNKSCEPQTPEVPG